MKMGVATEAFTYLVPFLLGTGTDGENQLALADDTQVNVTPRPQVIEDPGCYASLTSFLASSS